MIFGFAKRGRGDGQAAVEYVSGGAVNYVTGEHTSRGTRRSQRPEVLRGDPAVTAALTRAVPFQFKYVSGMAAFAPDDRVTPQLQDKVMDEFERHAFPGLQRGRDFNILWVRHSEKHTHLHFISPRIHLRTGRSLNPAPPGSRTFFDLLRTKLNLEFNLSDPTDPARTQALRLPKHLARLRSARAQQGREPQPDIRELVAQHILAQVRNRTVTDRDGVAAAVRAAGLTVRREGRDYITILHPATHRPIRLRGGLFERGAALEQFVANRSITPAAPNRERLQAVTEKLEQLRARRERYNHNRYGRPNNKLELTHDPTRTPIGQRHPAIAPAVPPARDHRDRALERFDRAVGSLERASQQLERASRALGQGLERFHTWHRERQADSALIRKYATPVRDNAQLHDRGLEMEREVEFP
jgi:MobA/VirD2-like, nuclease domain